MPADSSGNAQAGAYAGGVTLGGTSGVGVTGDKSITLNGTNGNVASNNTALTSPPVYSEEAWFKTNTTTGGQLIGFGSSKTGASGTYDRQVYMTNSGTLALIRSMVENAFVRSTFSCQAFSARTSFGVTPGKASQPGN